MSLTLLGWLLIVPSSAILALLILSLRSDTLRRALPSPLRSSDWKLGKRLRGTAGTLVLAGAAFVLVAGIGAATSSLRETHPPTGSEDTISFSPTRSAVNGEILTRLKNYARSGGPEQPVSMPAAGNLLPDVNTMIERLAARLEANPEDVKGWRMLGWSYFNTGRYEEAAAAYARAAKLDPDSSEIKSSYEEAKAKAASLGSRPEAMPAPERDAAIRSMVDGLASRLESSPRDVEGWTRLMRSRVVLGERQVATTAFRKALEVFKDDSTATDKIMAAATELGLKAE